MSFEKLQIVFISILIPLGIFYWYTHSQNVSLMEVFLPSVPVMRIGDVPVRIEIAKSDETRIQGLSGRKDLTTVNGLLFVFPEAEYHAIWMKDMLFPIDIIWIGEDMRIIGIDKNVSPDTYPKTFRPVRPVKYILETNVHYSDTFGINVGQLVTLPPELLDK